MLTAAERAAVGRMHHRVLADARLMITPEEVARCIITPTMQRRASTAAHRAWAVIRRAFVHRTSDYAGQMFLRVLRQAEDPRLLQAFGIPADDFNARGHFLLLHVWVVHRKLMALGEVGFDTVFWEDLWRYFERVMRKEGYKGKTTKSLAEIKRHTFGLCVMMDEGLEESNDFFGRLHYILWSQTWRNDESKYDTPEAHDLTVYAARMLSFADMLDHQSFMEARFHWASWEEGLLPHLRSPTLREAADG